MKKYLLPTLFIVLVFISIAAYLFVTNSKSNRPVIATRPLYIKNLKEGILAQNISLEDACKNPRQINKSILEITNASFEERFIYLCEDYNLSNELKENFNNNSDYKYFLNCAKNYAAQMQQVMKDLKEHYPEDYKALNFKQEEVLLRYLKHPDSAYLAVQCESKSEALYWKSISQSDKVEDLQFCIQVTQECISGKSKAEECPTNFENYNKECSKKLNKMRAH